MAPSRIETDENGHVKGIYVTPQMISKIKDGRASVRPTGAPDVFIPCQTLIVAIGQDIEYQHFEEAGVPVQRGKILTEKYGGFDNIPGVFAGGDCASGPASVIKAIAAAKVVAANIDEYLGYHHIISCDVEIPEARLDDRSHERKKREKNEIGIVAVRGGTIVGQHDVIFAGADEVIEFHHTAYSKAIFGKGAVEAAKFLAGKPAGMYDMSDVIGL